MCPATDIKKISIENDKENENLCPLTDRAPGGDGAPGDRGRTVLGGGCDGARGGGGDPQVGGASILRRIGGDPLVGGAGTISWMERDGELWGKSRQISTDFLDASD